MNQDENLQALHDDFIENTISNYYLLLGVAPILILTERFLLFPWLSKSSVVVAAAKAAKYVDRGGFRTEILGEEKIGKSFIYNGDGKAE